MSEPCVECPTECADGTIYGYDANGAEVEDACDCDCHLTEQAWKERIGDIKYCQLKDK